MYRIGIVSETKAGFVRVDFQEDNLVSDWLPIVFRGTTDNKDGYPLPINTQVACLMDENDEDGVCLGATYNDEDAPPDELNENTYVKKFKDGTTLIYDFAEHKLTADVNGDVELKAKKLDATLSGAGNITAPNGITITGNLTVVGNIAAGGIAASASGGGDGKIISDANIETTGEIKAADVKAGTVSLLTHTHSGVTTGGGTSGPPIL